MRILLKQATIISADINRNAIKDILIVDGIITEIGDNIVSNADTVISSKRLFASIGWFDVGCKLGDPGLEYKEDLNSGVNAAVVGGYTEIACFPNTKPCLQNKENIFYLNSKSLPLPVKVHVIAAATENLQGKVMTEIFDLAQAGAIAFSDGGNSIDDSGIMVRLIQYLSQIDGILMVQAEDKSLSSNGVMHEGEQSVFLGQKGIPSIAEEIIVDRNLSLLKYTKGQLHFNKISTASSVEKIRKAKKEGLKVSCDVAVANLIYDDTFLRTFDTNFKTNPPLRTEADRLELWRGLKDGTIDMIISDHTPQDEESKKLEFDHADFGMIQLETAFALLNTENKGKLEFYELIDLISKKPREVLKIEIPELKNGQKANITVFDPDIEWKYTNVKSRSRNSPEIGNTLKGKVLAIINKNQFIDLRN